MYLLWESGRYKDHMNIIADLVQHHGKIIDIKKSSYLDRFGEKSFYLKVLLLFQGNLGIVLLSQNEIESRLISQWGIEIYYKDYNEGIIQDDGYNLSVSDVSFEDYSFSFFEKLWNSRISSIKKDATNKLFYSQDISFIRQKFKKDHIHFKDLERDDYEEE